MNWTEFDISCMQHALLLAKQGEGLVEPNPMVGCVIAHEHKIIAQGWHTRFGAPHAEVEALLNLPPEGVKNATAYVTLEPCCHFGKTPPCTNALIAAGIERVVIAQRDPFPRVNGGGIHALQNAGIHVQVGCLACEAQELNAPYLHLCQHEQPWVIAKWAMSLDGKIATHSKHSQWISSAASREKVHTLRSRVDAVLVGIGTVLADDPLLTARVKSGIVPRTATRIILDSQAQISVESKLVKTVEQSPLLLVTHRSAPPDRLEQLQNRGCEIWQHDAPNYSMLWPVLLKELGHRRFTNLLVEGGATVLGSLRDADCLNEVHVFMAPKILGGKNAPSAISGSGVNVVPNTTQFRSSNWEQCESDFYFHGRLFK